MVVYGGTTGWPPFIDATHTFGGDDLGALQVQEACADGETCSVLGGVPTFVAP